MLRQLGCTQQSEGKVYLRSCVLQVAIDGSVAPDLEVLRVGVAHHFELSKSFDLVTVIANISCRSLGSRKKCLVPDKE